MFQSILRNDSVFFSPSSCISISNLLFCPVVFSPLLCNFSEVHLDKSAAQCLSQGRFHKSLFVFSLSLLPLQVEAGVCAQNPAILHPVHLHTHTKSVIELSLKISKAKYQADVDKGFIIPQNGKLLCSLTSKLCPRSSRLKSKSCFLTISSINKATRSKKKQQRTQTRPIKFCQLSVLFISGVLLPSLTLYLFFLRCQISHPFVFFY